MTSLPFVDDSNFLNLTFPVSNFYLEIVVQCEVQRPLRSNFTGRIQPGLQRVINLEDAAIDAHNGMEIAGRAVVCRFDRG